MKRLQLLFEWMMSRSFKKMILHFTVNYYEHFFNHTTIVDIQTNENVHSVSNGKIKSDL